MSSFSFRNFHRGMSRKFSTKPSQSTISKERQSSNLPRAFSPNIDEMKRIFDKFDTNKDGKISREEYNSALKSLKIINVETDMETAFRGIDSDGDGFIDFEEFMKVYKMDGGVKKSEIQSAFRVFDVDGNGKISAEELWDVFKRLGEKCSLEACRKMVKGVDSDGDGLIDIDEFMNMMTRNMKPSSY